MLFSDIRFHVVKCNASFSCKQIAMIHYGFFTVYMSSGKHHTKPNAWVLFITFWLHTELSTDWLAGDRKVRLMSSDNKELIFPLFCFNFFIVTKTPGMARPILDSGDLNRNACLLHVLDVTLTIHCRWNEIIAPCKTLRPPGGVWMRILTFHVDPHWSP